MERRSSGGNYPAITLDELQNIMIPIVKPSRRTEIITHIETIYEQAKQLRAEGQAIIERAKQEVEAMILGDASPDVMIWFRQQNISARCQLTA